MIEKRGGYYGAIAIEMFKKTFDGYVVFKKIVVDSDFLTVNFTQNGKDDVRQFRHADVLEYINTQIVIHQELLVLFKADMVEAKKI